MTADTPVPSEWTCYMCYTQLINERGTWRFPVFLVEELRAPMGTEEVRVDREFCSRKCLTKYYE